MRFLWVLVDRLVEILKIIGAVSLVGMAILTCADVVGRFFGHPIFGSVEIVGYLAILTVATALPFTHRAKGHIGVEILVRLFSERTQAIISVATGIASLVLFAIVTWRMFLYAGTTRASGEVSMNLEFPEYLLIYAVCFCFLAFTLQVVKDIKLDIDRIRGCE